MLSHDWLERAEKASDGKGTIEFALSWTVGWASFIRGQNFVIRPVLQTLQLNDSKLRYDARHVGPSFTA